MRQRVIQYSEAFKRQVVEELEKGQHRSVGEVRKKYGTGGCDTVQNWVKKYGREQKEKGPSLMEKWKTQLSVLEPATGSGVSHFPTGPATNPSDDF